MIFPILILALVLRLISLNQSLWLDEATTAYVASHFNFGEIITRFAPSDFHPPLYYLVIRAWSLVFGTSEIALRMPSVIFGVLTIWVVYKIGKSKLAALLAATSGLLIYYSQEARMYSLVTLLVSYLVYWFMKKKWFLFSIFLLLVGMTDYPALLIIPVFWILAGKDWKKLAISHLPLAFSYFFWWPVFLRQLSSGLSVGASWSALLGETNFKNVALIPVKFILGRISFDNKNVYALIVIIACVIFGYLLFRSIKNLKLFWAWLIIPIILAALIGFKISIFSYFRLIFVLPAFYILVAQGISNLKKPWVYLFACYVLGVNLLGSSAYLLVPKFHREDWRGLVNFVESQKKDKSITLFVADSNMEAYRYYAPNAKIAGPEALKAGYDQIWLMCYVKDIFDPNDTLKSKVESLKYQKVGKYDFNGVVVWKYTE